MEDAVKSDATQFIVVREGSGPYVIQGVGGGKVPTCLQGLWNSKRLADSATDMYTQSRDKPKRTYRRDSSKVEAVKRGRSKDKS